MLAGADPGFWLGGGGGGGAQKIIIMRHIHTVITSANPEVPYGRVPGAA